MTEQLEPVAQARDLDLHCVVHQPVTVSGDSGWLERLLLNLLDNAIKYTPPRGHIRVGVSREDNQARVDVSDTGPGIRADAVPHIFERFYRVDPARSSAVEGAGLGSPFAKSNHVEGRGGHLGFLKFLLARKGRVQFVWNLNDGQRKLRALRGLRQ